MAQLHYLTVQDILWVNLQATKKVQHFNFARLEEATYYQYAYGDSSSLIPQAGRFLTGFLRMHPFETGNESTALVSCATFLKINGGAWQLSDQEGINWLDKVMTKQCTGTDAVSNCSAEDPHFHGALKPDIRATIRSVVEGFPLTIAGLSDRSATAK